MADTNRVQLKYSLEDTYGTHNTTGTELRFTGESLNYNISNIVSNEIRSDRQTTDLVQTGAETGGGINGELSYGAYDDFMEGAMWSDWSDDVGISLTTIAAVSDGFTTTTANGFTAIVQGQWIRVNGFTTSSINTYYWVTTRTSATAIVTTPNPATTETAGNTVTMEGSYIRNGATEKSFTIERGHLDMSPIQYFQFTGMEINSMTFSVESESISTISFDFIGSTSSATQTAIAFTNSVSAATQDVMNAVSHVGSIFINGVEDTSTLINRVEFTIANNIRGKKAIGTLGNADLGAGKVDVTGSMSVYFADPTTFYDRYTGSTEFSISFKMEDVPEASWGTGNAYIFTFPRCKIETDNVNAGGADADVMEEMTFRAIRFSTDSYTFQICKFAA